MLAAPPRVTFVYLGRRGALARFTLDLARALDECDDIRASFIISQVNELGGAFNELREPPVRVGLFSHGAGAVLEAWRIVAARRALAQAYAYSKPCLVVELMPHLWSPFFEDLPARAGARRAAVLHDWRAHPGDGSGLATRWLAASALRADRVFTLSRAVAEQVIASRPDAAGRVAALFHPDFRFSPAAAPARAAGPLRVLFMGRLMAYKGLDLFVAGAEQAKARGADLAVTILGAGEIGALRPRLEALNAEIVNRWVSDAEMDAALARCDVVAATYREASQSGVVAAAFGAGRPVLATPVGALAEQIGHERTGLIAVRTDADAVADALERLARDPALVQSLAAGVVASASKRSMRAFARAVVQNSEAV